MGTPAFAIPALKSILCSHHQIVGVVTQPDRPQGRHLRLESPPVKQVALAEGLTVFQPERLTEDFKKVISALTPAAAVVAAYGKIIPEWLLDLFPFGCVNIHGSLLPKYRGAAPIQRAILGGESETGITIMQMDKGLDTGGILMQEKTLIGEEETAGELEKRLAELGASMIVKALDGLAAGALNSIPQNDNEATYAPKIEKKESLIRWKDSADKIHRLIRSLNPHPVAHTSYRKKRLKVWRARMDCSSADSTRSPGTIIKVDPRQGLLVATGTGLLLIEEIQPEGKNKMSGAEFVRGYHPQIGEVLG